MEELHQVQQAGTGRSRPSAENLEKFREIHSKSPDEQAQHFLMSFIFEFTGRSDEVLECAHGFKGYLESPSDNVLTEVQAHRLLEDLGRAKTYKDMRDVIREIDQDNDGMISLMEWLLFEFNKTVDELYAVKDRVPPELRETMQSAIDEWRRVNAMKDAKKSEVESLEALAAAGGVKGAQAKIKLAAIKQLGVGSKDIETEIRAERGKKKAEALVETHAKKEAAAEQARVDEIKRKEEEERARQRAEGRARMMAMANKFGATGSSA